MLRRAKAKSRLGLRTNDRRWRVANGTLNYSSAEHDSMDVTVQGNTATLIGKSRVHAAVFGGGWHTWRLEQDLHLVKKENRWLITLAEASTY